MSQKKNQFIAIQLFNDFRSFPPSPPPSPPCKILGAYESVNLKERRSLSGKKVILLSFHHDLCGQLVYVDNCGELCICRASTPSWRK